MKSPQPTSWSVTIPAMRDLVTRNGLPNMRSVFASARRLGLVALLGAVTACATQGLRAAVTMHVERHEDTPRDALVYVDEQYIGTLSDVAARGVRLPEGKHRVTVEKAGYFPYDVIVVSDREPIYLDVQLVRLPD